jgi:hypothetical protein
MNISYSHVCYLCHPPPCFYRVNLMNSTNYVVSYVIFPILMLFLFLLSKNFIQKHYNFEVMSCLILRSSENLGLLQQRSRSSIIGLETLSCEGKPDRSLLAIQVSEAGRVISDRESSRWSSYTNFPVSLLYGQGTETR